MVRLMVPCMVQYVPAYMAPKMVPEITILPEELLILAEGLLCDLWYFFRVNIEGPCKPYLNVYLDALGGE